MSIGTCPERASCWAEGKEQVGERRRDWGSRLGGSAGKGRRWSASTPSPGEKEAPNGHSLLPALTFSSSQLLRDHLDLGALQTPPLELGEVASMSSLRPSVSLLALAARRAAPGHAPGLSTAGALQRRFLPTSSSAAAGSGSHASSSSSSGSQQRDKANPNKHKQWYRELVPAALPALAIGLGVYMVRPNGPSSCSTSICDRNFPSRHR